MKTSGLVRTLVSFVATVAKAGSTRPVLGHAELNWKKSRQVREYELVPKQQE
jgi:hypothetical protein